ncbi:Na(+)-translocating NADH-quinone reductase subunit C [bacterium]|nr:Na(+)-translocating NADH-quinone reductase subunit C [bacterium]
MARESAKKTLIVALSICIVCSFLVSLTAVSLKGMQEENKKRERIKNIIAAAGIPDEYQNSEDFFKNNIIPIVVDMKTSRAVSPGKLPFNPEDFDLESVLKKPDLLIPVPTESDIAKIGKIPAYIVIYKVLKNDFVDKFIFPVYGKGLWSTMYGYIALDKDLRTVTGITFYQHGETPGLGGEIDNKKWKKSWSGKQAFDINGNMKIRVIKGKVKDNDPEKMYKINGLSGATLTTRGVNNTVNFWLGPKGYGPYLDYLRRKTGNE